MMIKLELLVGIPETISHMIVESISWEKFFLLIRRIINGDQVEVLGLSEARHSEIILIFVKSFFYMDYQFHNHPYRNTRERKVLLESPDLLHDLSNYLLDLGWTTISYFVKSFPELSRKITCRKSEDENHLSSSQEGN